MAAGEEGRGLGGEDGVVQRNCLWSIAETAPLDKVRDLLLDRRVVLKYRGSKRSTLDSCLLCSCGISSMLTGNQNRLPLHKNANHRR